MALEIGNFISDLNAANPNNTDLKSQGDDHLRLLKKTLKASFPNVAGAVTKTHTELNAAHDFRVPAGGIIMWSGAVLNIPAGWLLCNGINGTPNLLDRFVIGAGNLYAVDATGGSKDAVVAAHSHTATLTGSAAAAGSHTHGVNDPGHRHVSNVPNEFALGESAGGGTSSDGLNGSGRNVYTSSNTTGISIAAAGDHAHNVSVSGSTASAGVPAANANLPPYYALCFIMKSA
jgi:hypothetical protein